MYVMSLIAVRIETVCVGSLRLCACVPSTLEARAEGA